MAGVGEDGHGKKKCRVLGTAKKFFFVCFLVLFAKKFYVDKGHLMLRGMCCEGRKLCRKER